MKFKGRRQSTNVEDMRGSSSGRSIGLKGGLIGTLAIALVVYLLGGNPMDVLRMSNQGQTETTSGEAVLTGQEQEMTEFVSVVLADTEEVWKKIFREYGATYREPKLVLFRSAVSSACGYAQAATGPFYCPGDEKVYLDLDYLEALQRKLEATGDFAVAYIIAHEVGHHVQLLMGTMEEVQRAQQSARSQDQANELKTDELTRLFNKLGTVDPRSRDEIRIAFDRLVNKILHPPLESLRDEAHRGTPHGLLDALKRLFQIQD